MYRTILVPLDGSPGRHEALPFATQIARACGARVILMQAALAQGDNDAALAQLQARLTATATASLATIADDVRAQGVTVSIATPAARPEDALPMQIELDGVDLVVMTTRPRSLFGRWMFGSVAEAILSSTHTPLFLARMGSKRDAAATMTQARFLVPLDGSFFAEAAIPHALEMAHNFHGSVRLLGVVVPPKSQSRSRLPSQQTVVTVSDGVERANHYLDALAASLRAEGINVDTDVQVGEAADTILREAKDCSVVVMSTHGRSGLARLTAGSVAMEVLKRGDCPVLMVRPETLSQPRVVPPSRQSMPLAQS